MPPAHPPPQVDVRSLVHRALRQGCAFEIRLEGVSRTKWGTRSTVPRRRAGCCDGTGV